MPTSLKKAAAKMIKDSPGKKTSESATTLKTKATAKKVARRGRSL